MSDTGSQPAEVPSTAKDNPSGENSKASTRLLTPSDSDYYSSLPSFDRPSPDKPFELPTDQESVAALEFIGFTQATAQKIYQRWEGRPDPEKRPYSFLEHATGQLENWDQGDMSDADFMTKIGLKKEFQDAILDPRFVSIFGTGDLEFWIKDTLESRYRSMTNLQRRRRNLALSGDRGKDHTDVHASSTLEEK